MKFENKTILITGASTGIGKALAIELSKIDCNLLLIARRIELLKQLKTDLENRPANISVYQCDVSKKSEVKKTFIQISETHDFVDIAILNSGFGVRVIPEEYNSQHAEETFGANVFGIIYWVEQLLPKYIEKKTGLIAGVSSLADVRGYSGSGFYCASKAAASKYLEGLAIELDGYGINILTVRPGFVKTPMTDKNEFPMPFLMSPEKAAEIILKGISRKRRYIQFPWQIVWLTRIVEFIPNWLFELMSRKDYKKKRRAENENK
jgi:short-subunit dehydrogenase